MPNQSKRQSQLREAREAKRAKLSSDDAETLEVDGINENVHEWVSTLHRDAKMSLTLLLHVKLNLELVEASELIGSMVGVSERAVRGWRATFLSNGNTFPDWQQGKYHRAGVLRKDEELNRNARAYVTENANPKGRPNMTALSFCAWVNDDFYQIIPFLLDFLE